MVLWVLESFPNSKEAKGSGFRVRRAASAFAAMVRDSADKRNKTGRDHY